MTPLEEEMLERIELLENVFQLLMEGLNADEATGRNAVSEGVAARAWEKFYE
jgi:hypothetical protein